MSEISKVATPSMSALVLPFAYALSTLLFLWAAAGGDLALLQTRLLGWQLASFLGLWVLSKRWKPELFRVRIRGRREWAIGIGAGLAAFAPSAAVLLLTRQGFLPWNFQIPAVEHWMLIPALGIAMPILAELFVRGWVAPSWGYGGVAFLDALVLACGFQSGFVFVTHFLLGLLLGTLAQRVSLGVAVLARVTWSLLTILLLYWM